MARQKLEELEQAFVNVRQQRLQHLTNGTLTPEMEDQLSRAELRALYALLDHRAEHDNQRPSKLPASRNIGGIIGPY